MVDTNYSVSFFLIVYDIFMKIGVKLMLRMI